MRNDTHIVQFWIGRFDKNGTRIFDGDIVRLTEIHRDYMGQDDSEAQMVTWTGVVRFNAACFWLQGVGRSENCWFRHDEKNLEVIGNMFENPELMPKKADGHV